MAEALESLERSLDNRTPSRAQTPEHIHTGTTRASVISAPRAVLIPIIVVGMRLKEQQPKMARVIISSLAVVEVRESIFSIALIASGVEALAMPSIFALMQAVISSVAILFLNDEGKTSLRMGRNIFERARIIPASLKTFKIPFQSAIIPTREITKFTLFAAPKKSPLDIEFGFPQKNAYRTDMPQIILKHFPNIF